MHGLLLSVLFFIVIAQAGSFSNFIISALSTLIVGFLCLVGLGWFWERLSRSDQNVTNPKLTEEEAKCRKVIEIYAAELQRKRRLLIKDLGYGIKDDSKWIKEKNFFIQEILKRHERAAAVFIGDIELQRLIDQSIGGTSGRIENSIYQPPKENPVLFEHYCADILEKHGWQVSTTKASGDQGADLIAKKNGEVVVLQCKQYRGSVGNAAVQQAFSAKSHYAADHAGVVTESRYTKSAIELSESTGVLLLDPEMLSSLDAFLK